MHTEEVFVELLKPILQGYSVGNALRSQDSSVAQEIEALLRGDDGND